MLPPGREEERGEMDIQANIESGYLQDATLGELRQIVKRTIKDSVFTKNPNVWIFHKITTLF